MKRTAVLLTLAGAMFLGACDNESSLPVATGKASIRAINGVKTASDVGFLIEERTLGTAGYRQITTLNRFDDLSYNFNFDVFYSGEAELIRVASVFQDIVKDTDYVFVLTGTLADPSVLIWETPAREFTGAETVFEARFAHTADSLTSLGSVDYYFAEPGVLPAAGNAVGTLAFGEVLTSVDFEAGEYVLTITEAGLPGEVLFESGTILFAPATQYIVSSFDGDANTFAPIVVRAITSGVDSIGGSITMSDVNYPPTVEFVNGSLAINTVDIYEDALLTSQIVAGHAYKDMSAAFELAPGDNPVFYTPTTLLSPVLIDDVVSFFGGLRGRVVAYGPADDFKIRPYVPDRRPVETQAKLHLYNANINFGLINIYVVDTGTTIEGKAATRPAVPGGVALSVIGLPAGSFDIYITEFGSIEVLAGPIPIDVELGDVLGGMIFDTADPAILELNFLPNNP
jgi:hypothetical protein